MPHMPQCLYAPYLRSMKILMVCLGNICRSPLAEGILQDKANKAGLNWVVDSAGTANYHVGEAPHRLSQKVAKLNAISISSQQCRQFKASDIAEFDIIYAMDQSNYNDIKAIAGEQWNADKVRLILNELYPEENLEVPDPWYGGEEGFHDVFKLLSEACEKIVQLH